MANLWQRATPDTITSGALVSTTEYGVAFVVQSDGYLRELAWYRGGTGAGRAPTTLRLWDTATQTVVYTAASVPDSGAVDWQVHTVTAAVPLALGREYRVSACYPATTTTSIAFFSTVGTANSPLSFAASSKWNHLGACAFPEAVISSNAWLAHDVRWEATAPAGNPDVPPTTGDVQNALAAWLSTTDGSHADSAPLQDHTTLNALKATSDDLTSGLAGAAHGYYASVQTAITAIKSVTDTLPTPIARLSSIVLDHYTADIAAILAQIDAVVSGQTAPNADIKRLGGSVFLPASGWTLVDEIDFTDELAWNVAGDLYVVTIASVPAGQSPDSFAGVTWYHRLGSWAVLNGDQIAGGRQFLEFTPQQLLDGGRRMPGLAIHCKPGTLGHVQAWQLA